MQDCSISIANALDILQSCTKPSISPFRGMVPDCSNSSALAMDLSTVLPQVINFKKPIFMPLIYLSFDFRIFLLFIKSHRIPFPRILSIHNVPGQFCLMKTVAFIWTYIGWKKNLFIQGWITYMYWFVAMELAIEQDLSFRGTKPWPLS